MFLAIPPNLKHLIKRRREEVSTSGENSAVAGSLMDTSEITVKYGEFTRTEELTKCYEAAAGGGDQLIWAATAPSTNPRRYRTHVLHRPRRSPRTHPLGHPPPHQSPPPRLLAPTPAGTTPTPSTAPPAQPPAPTPWGTPHPTNRPLHGSQHPPKQHTRETIYPLEPREDGPPPRRPRGSSG